MADETKNSSTMGLNTPTILLIGGVVLLVWNKIFGKSETDLKAEAEEKKLTDLPIDKNPLELSYKGLKAPAGMINYRSTLTSPAVPSNYFSSAVVALKNAIGRFTDDESVIIAAMKKAATKFELNIMAQTYTVLYKKDLWYELKDNLSASELLQITSYVNKLPDFIKGKKIK